MRAIGGTNGSRAAKVIIDMGGVIPCMGGEDEVMGGKGFQGGILTGKEGMTSGRETT